MKKIQFKEMGTGEKFSLLAALVSLIALIAFCIYGAVYNYFDTVVAICLVGGAVLAVVYDWFHSVLASLCNLFSAGVLSFGLGLFFLNSYPVWADRLNHIKMYGSRGTLVPVIAIMVLIIAAVLLQIISCFNNGEKGATK